MKLWILALSFLSNLSLHAQQIQVAQFSMPSSLWNPSTNTLTVKRVGPSPFLTPVGIVRPNLPEWTHSNLQFNVELEVFAIKNDGGQSVKISEGINFATGDFIGNTSVAALKYPTVTIPANFIGEAGGKMILKFRYYKTNYPLPDDKDGWTDWYTANTNINLKLEDLVSSISGPDQICAEGIYTLTNPGTITLENANGIATLTALGNNQWKVTRIGTANGLVTLKSTNQQNTVTSKPIEIGILAPTTIFGPNSVTYNSTYTFSSGDLDPNITYYWTVTNAPAGTNIIGGTSNKSFTISLPPKTSSLPENGTLLISVRRSGACSGSSDSFVKQIPYTTSSGGGKPPIQIP